MPLWIQQLSPAARYGRTVDAALQKPPVLYYDIKFDGLYIDVI